MGTKNNPSKYDCYAKAAPGEPMFILLARDPLAPTLVRMWADARAAKGEPHEVVAEARACADAMDDYHKTKMQARWVEWVENEVQEVLLQQLCEPQSKPVDFNNYFRVDKGVSGASVWLRLSAYPDWEIRCAGFPNAISDALPFAVYYKNRPAGAMSSLADAKLFIERRIKDALEIGWLTATQ